MNRKIRAAFIIICSVGLAFLIVQISLLLLNNSDIKPRFKNVTQRSPATDLIDLTQKIIGGLSELRHKFEISISSLFQAISPISKLLSYFIPTARSINCLLVQKRL